jgi:DNA-binding HxlR family transcriptional regulator
LFFASIGRIAALLVNGKRLADIASMVMKATEWRGCPIRYVAGLIGDRWKLLILRDLAFKDAGRFRDFAAAEGIASNVLSAKLAELEAGGIVARAIDPALPGRPRYALTAKGRDLVPALLALIEWSARWDPASEVPAGFRHDLETDPKALAERIRDRLAGAGSSLQE